MISEETGITLPDDCNLHVVSDDAENGYLVLPPSPRLTEEQLASVQGDSYHDWINS